MRICAACRRKEDRLLLIRISLDEKGDPAQWRGTGRSVYVHPDADCIEKLVKKGTLERSLRRRLGEAGKIKLKEELLCQLR